jgi:hypothetical protein
LEKKTNFFCWFEIEKKSFVEKIPWQTFLTLSPQFVALLETQFLSKCSTKLKTNFKEGEKPGLVVRAKDSRPRGRGFESRCILDECKRFASYYIKEKLKLKVAKWGTPKKIFKKQISKKLETNLKLFILKEE